jgi:fluoroacetyl-CoA thioesterase
MTATPIGRTVRARGLMVEIHRESVVFGVEAWGRRFAGSAMARNRRGIVNVVGFEKRFGTRQLATLS